MIIHRIGTTISNLRTYWMTPVYIRYDRPLPDLPAYQSLLLGDVGSPRLFLLGDILGIIKKEEDK